MEISATYDPGDNKIRLRVSEKLPADLYARVLEAGYILAPKQGFFVAPMWTPAREDLALELAGELGDEDTSLVDRAEERAERFEEYSEKRAADFETVKNQVDGIADQVNGQPILIGHHSERRARKDADRIENGMRKAVKLWEQSKYWEDRAAGAIRHAKYKERPDVRARRIKTIEAAQRKAEKEKKQAEGLIKLWGKLDQPATLKSGEPASQMDKALHICNFYDDTSRCFALADYPRELPASQYEGERSLWSALTDGIISPGQARDLAVPAQQRTIDTADRWLVHYRHRLLYENAMKGEKGAIAAEVIRPEVGGAVQWWNSPGHGQGWSYIAKVHQVSVSVLSFSDNYADRQGRTHLAKVPLDKLKAVLSPGQVQRARDAGMLSESEQSAGFFLFGELPELSGIEKARTADADDLARDEEEADRKSAARAKVAEVEGLRASLRAGVQVVAVPQLFPTPPDLARQVVALAELEDGQRILEPSAGTGSLLAAIGHARKDVKAVAVELSEHLAAGLRAHFMVNVETICGDFLTQNGNLGTFDRILMNPPFAQGADIQHIRHARRFLKPGGRLVAICANGPRQQAALKPEADQWLELPAGSFAEAGTNVSAAICVFNAPPAPEIEPEPIPTPAGPLVQARLF